MRIKNTVISALMGVIIIFFAFAVSWVAENVHTDSFGIQGSYSSLVVQDDSTLSRADRERIEESGAISKLKDFLDRENIDIVAVPTGDSFPPGCCLFTLPFHPMGKTGDVRPQQRCYGSRRKLCLP